jgi:hypothetical protein
MANKFRDLGGTFTLMDDVLRFTKPVPGETREQLEMRHLDLLERFLDRVVAAKLRLKLPNVEKGKREKCEDGKKREIRRREREREGRERERENRR